MWRMGRIGVVVAGLTPMWVTPAAAQALDELSWMAGCWRLSAGPSVVDEQWMAPSGGAMLGMSRTVREGSLVAYEHLRIEERDGLVRYVANPSAQAEASFTLRPGPEGEILFENPEHDFPQRIRYRPVGPDSLVATIEAGSGAQERRVSFPFARVACPG